MIGLGCGNSEEKEGIGVVVYLQGKGLIGCREVKEGNR